MNFIHTDPYPPPITLLYCAYVAVSHRKRFPQTSTFSSLLANLFIVSTSSIFIGWVIGFDGGKIISDLEFKLAVSFAAWTVVYFSLPFFNNRIFGFLFSLVNGFKRARDISLAVKLASELYPNSIAVPLVAGIFSGWASTFTVFWDAKMRELHLFSGFKLVCGCSVILSLLIPVGLGYLDKLFSHYPIQPWKWIEIKTFNMFIVILFVVFEFYKDSLTTKPAKVVKSGKQKVQ